MKRFISWLCIITLLLCMLSFASCKDDEVEEGGGENVEQTETPAPEDNKNSDDKVVNQDNTMNDDAANDIFS